MVITLRDSQGKISKGNNFKHGLSKDSIYDCWVAMKARCLNPQHPSYKDYGGRGIKICDSWLKDFGTFLNDLGPKPDKYSTLDRINNNGNYEPDNCRWISIQDQQKNRSNNNIVPGVHYEKSRNKWHVDITRFGKKIFLGRFKDFDIAKKVRLEAEERYAI